MNATENTQLARRSILTENCFNHGQEISWISFFVFKIENASFQSMCQIFLNWKRILNYTRDCVCTGVVVYIYTAAILLKIKIWRKKKLNPMKKILLLAISFLRSTSLQFEKGITCDHFFKFFLTISKSFVMFGPVPY